jgi:hypothetical protein
VAEPDFSDEDLEAQVFGSFIVPLIRDTITSEPPKVHIEVGEQSYHYERSFPIKGHSAVLPPYLAEQMGTGRKPLLIERPTRYYVYFAEA